MTWPVGGVMKHYSFPPEILETQGACSKLGKRVNIFFPEDGENYREAIEVCSTCPVRRQCAEWAVEHLEYGCWGGLTDQNRRIIRRSKRNPLPWPTGLEHGKGKASFNAHLHRGQIPCDTCYEGKPNNGSTLNRKSKNGKANENGMC